MTTPRNVAVVGLLAAVLAVAGGVVAAGTTGLLVSIALIQLGTFLSIIVVWRDIVRRSQLHGREVVRQLNRIERKLEAEPSEGSKKLDRIAASLQRHGEAAARLQRDAIRQLEVSDEVRIAKLAGRIEGRHQQSDEKLTKHVTAERQKTVRLLGIDSRKSFQQIEALAALYYELRPLRAFPATRSWVASPDLLRWLGDRVRQEGPELVVECGSGLSTIVMSYAMREVGHGRVVALEHDEHYHAVSCQLVDDHGLSDWADVRLAPLQDVEVEGEAWPWYDLAAVPDGPIDLLLVDGPPGNVRPQARFPAVPLLLDRLSRSGIVVLDDHDREEEASVADRWRDLYPGLTLEHLKHEKGTAVLRWGEDATAASDPDSSGGSSELP